MLIAELGARCSTPNDTGRLLNTLHPRHLFQLLALPFENDHLIRLLQSNSDERALLRPFRLRRQREVPGPPPAEILECRRGSGDDLPVVLEVKDGQDVVLVDMGWVVRGAVRDEEVLAVGRNGQLSARPVTLELLRGLREDRDVGPTDGFEFKVVVLRRWVDDFKYSDGVAQLVDQVAERRRFGGGRRSRGEEEMSGASAGADVRLIGLLQRLRGLEDAEGIRSQVGADEVVARGVEEDSVRVRRLLSVGLLGSEQSAPSSYPVSVDSAIAAESSVLPRAARRASKLTLGPAPTNLSSSSSLSVFRNVPSSSSLMELSEAPE